MYLDESLRRPCRVCVDAGAASGFRNMEEVDRSTLPGTSLEDAEMSPGGMSGRARPLASLYHPTGRASSGDEAGSLPPSQVVIHARTLDDEVVVGRRQWRRSGTGAPGASSEPGYMMMHLCAEKRARSQAQDDRVGLLHTLATLPEHPESVPINALVPVDGTPLGDDDTKAETPDIWDMGRMIATARVVMPRTMVRLSAGRLSFSEAEQVGLQGWTRMGGGGGQASGERGAAMPG